MGEQIITALVTIATAIVGVAIISVLVSKNANTSQVIGAAGTAYSGALATAMGGVTGYTPGGGVGGGGFGSMNVNMGGFSQNFG
jgi:hypothetical protein